MIMLQELLERYNERKDVLFRDSLFVREYEEKFLIRYTYESTVMEGNTLTYQETEDLLLRNITPGGKDLREIYEQINHKRAFAYINEQVQLHNALNEERILEIHRIITENIFRGGVYRRVQVRIAGAKHECPYPDVLPVKLQNFYDELDRYRAVCGLPESEMDAFKLACWAHAEFVAIHPFLDGNGRTSRMILNYILIEHGYVPVSIPLDRKKEYGSALDHYACTGELEPFMRIIEELEREELEYLIECAENLTVDSEPGGELTV